MKPFGKCSPNSPPSTGRFEPTHLLLSNPLANFRQIRHIRHFHQGPSSKLICICENISHNFAKFAGFAKFAIFATFAKSFDKILSNLPFSPLHGQFCQIHHIRRFRQKPWQNFVKFAIFATACISGHISGVFTAFYTSESKSVAENWEFSLIFQPILVLLQLVMYEQGMRNISRLLKNL